MKKLSTRELALKLGVKVQAIQQAVYRNGHYKGLEPERTKAGYRWVVG